MPHSSVERIDGPQVQDFAVSLSSNEHMYDESLLAGLYMPGRVSLLVKAPR